MRISGPSYVLYAKFAMKLSATVTPRWEGVVSRGEATHRDFVDMARFVTAFIPTTVCIEVILLHEINQVFYEVGQLVGQLFYEVGHRYL